MAEIVFASYKSIPRPLHLYSTSPQHPPFAPATRSLSLSLLRSAAGAAHPICVGRLEVPSRYAAPSAAALREDGNSDGDQAKGRSMAAEDGSPRDGLHAPQGGSACPPQVMTGASGVALTSSISATLLPLFSSDSPLAPPVYWGFVGWLGSIVKQLSSVVKWPRGAAASPHGAFKQPVHS
jgi:hypothetical protein